MTKSTRSRHSKPALSELKNQPLLSTSRTLIWIDSRPLLEKERKRCEKIAYDLECAKKDLERFRTEWQPAFSRWLHGKFGERITRVRELEAKADELGRIVSHVEMESLYSGRTERAIYSQFEKMRERAARSETSEGTEDFEVEEDAEEMNAKKRSSDSNGEGGKEGRESEEAKHRAEFPPEIEKFLKKEFKQMFGHFRLSAEEEARMFASFKQAFREDVMGESASSHRGDDWENEGLGNDRGQRAAAGRECPPKPETQEDVRRRQIYRDLARKLHPDVNSNLTPREKDLWHEVRAAYESKNLEQLETLSAMLEGGGVAGYSKVESISRLHSIFKDFQRKLKATQSALKQAKKQPSWNFSEIESQQPDKLNKLSREIARDLDDATEELEEAVSHYELQIERWKAPPRVRRKPQPPKGVTRSKDHPPRVIRRRAQG